MIEIRNIKRSYGKYLYKKGVLIKKRNHDNRALKIFLKVKKIFYELQDEENYLKTLYHIGQVYFHMHRYNRALTTFQEIKEKTSDQPLIMAIAECYKEMGDFSQFIDYEKIVLDMETNTLKKAAIMLDLSEAYRLNNNKDLALCCAEKALKIYQEVHHEESYEVGQCYVLIALSYIELKDYKNAVKYLEKTEHIYESIKVERKSLLSLYRLLEYTFNRIGYKDTAVFYMGKYNKLVR